MITVYRRVKSKMATHNEHNYCDMTTQKKDNTINRINTDHTYSVLSIQEDRLNNLIVLNGIRKDHGLYCSPDSNSEETDTKEMCTCTTDPSGHIDTAPTAGENEDRYVF